MENWKCNVNNIMELYILLYFMFCETFFFLHLKWCYFQLIYREKEAEWDWQPLDIIPTSLSFSHIIFPIVTPTVVVLQVFIWVFIPPFSHLL